MSLGFFAKFRKRKAVQLFIQTFIEWNKDECLKMGAALAYYALFSIFPLLLLILSIFGFLVGPESTLTQRILTLAQESIPPDAYTIVSTTLTQLNHDSAGASIISLVLLLVSASGFFSALDQSFNKIWKMRRRQKPNDNFWSVVTRYIKDKAMSFALVLGSCFLLLLSQVSNIAIRVILRIIIGLTDQLPFIQLDQVLFLQALQLSSSFILLLLVVMTLFKVLPPCPVTWRDIWGGAVFTSLLLLGLQQLVSNSVVSIGSRFQSYGVVGGVMVLLLWIYLTSQVFFLGGEFTYVYSRMFGSRQRRKGTTDSMPYRETQEV